MHHRVLLLCLLLTIYLLFVNAAVYIPPTPPSVAYFPTVKDTLVDKTKTRARSGAKIGIRIVDVSFDMYQSYSRQDDSPIIPAHYLIQNELAPTDILSNQPGGFIGQFIAENVGIPNNLPLNNVSLYVDHVGRVNSTTGQVVGGFSFAMYFNSALVTSHLLVNILQIRRVEDLDMDRLRDRILGIDSLSARTSVGNYSLNPGVDWDWELYYTMTNYFAQGRCGYPVVQSTEASGKSVKIMQYVLKHCTCFESSCFKSNLITGSMGNTTLKAVELYKSYLSSQGRLYPERRKASIADELWRQLIFDASAVTFVLNEQSTLAICIQYILSRRFYKMNLREELFNYPVDQIAELKQVGLLPTNFGVFDSQTKDALIAFAKEFNLVIETPSPTQFKISDQAWRFFISGCHKSRTEPYGFIPIAITWFVAFCIVILGAVVLFTISFVMAFLSKRKELEQEFKGYTKQDADD